jgi:hypothetical protein
VIGFVRVLTIERVIYIYGQIDYPSILGFVKVLEVEGITYIY